MARNLKYDKDGDGRLRARPADKPGGEATAGEQTLGPGGGRETLLYAPPRCRADRPAPLAVLLHGAGGHARQGLDLLRDLADDAGLILLAPSSRLSTWDVIGGGYGPDITALDAALADVFGRYAIDPSRIAVGGFSDGASYALSVGLTNGDLFTHVVAFSPGFLAPAELHGKPRVYVSHGTHDRTLPIDPCSRRIVPSLRRAGYEVDYHEFDGPHTVPPSIAREGLGWFLGRPNPDA